MVGLHAQQRTARRRTARRAACPAARRCAARSTGGAQWDRRRGAAATPAPRRPPDTSRTGTPARRGPAASALRAAAPLVRTQPKATRPDTAAPEPGPAGTAEPPRAASADPALRLREDAAEMQEQRRRQEPRHHVAEVNRLCRNCSACRSSGRRTGRSSPGTAGKNAARAERCRGGNTRTGRSPDTRRPPRTGRRWSEIALRLADDTLAGTSMPPCRIWYSALRQAPSRARIAVASVAAFDAHAVDRNQDVVLVDSRLSRPDSRAARRPPPPAAVLPTR